MMIPQKRIISRGKLFRLGLSKYQIPSVLPGDNSVEDASEVEYFNFCNQTGAVVRPGQQDGLTKVRQLEDLH